MVIELDNTVLCAYKLKLLALDITFNIVLRSGCFRRLMCESPYFTR